MNYHSITVVLSQAFHSKIFAMFLLLLASSFMHEYIMFISLGFAVPLLTLLFAGVGSEFINWIFTTYCIQVQEHTHSNVNVSFLSLVLVVIFNLNGNFVVISCLTFGSYMICWFYFVEIGARRLCDREVRLMTYRSLMWWYITFKLQLIICPLLM